MWQKSSENLNPPSISLLELQGVHTTSRAIILNFGILHYYELVGTALPLLSSSVTI